MSAQLEFDLPWPYTFAAPLEVRQAPPGLLSIAEILPHTKPKELWAYEPATGLIRVARPLSDEVSDG